MTRLRDGYGSITAKNFFLPVRTNLKMIDSAMFLQNLQPALGLNVGVNINKHMSNVAGYTSKKYEKFIIPTF